MTEARERPLVGLRVLDTADELGELCGRILADLGADVIRVEPPAGAHSRHLPPFHPDGRSSLSFALRNAGKRGIRLDLSSAEGAEVFHQLLERTDIWVESDPPGSLAERGLGPATVLERHPSLIITSITNFGQSGPHRHFAGTDMIGYAMGGMLYRAGAPHRPPVVVPGAQAYDAASISAAFATLTAVFHRLASGRGQWLDISVQEATANLADWSVPMYSTLRAYMHREGAGAYPVFRCTDGWIRLIVLAPHQWRALRAWMGEPEELQDPALDEFLHRMVHRDRIDPLIQRLFESYEKQEAAREAQARGIAAIPVLRPSEVLVADHMRARGTFVDLEILPGQRAPVASGFLELDGARMGPTGRAPLLGEHDEEVLGREIQQDVQTTWSAVEDSSKARSLPFAGLFVLDFGVGAAGPEVGRLLAEYGADVVKIESSKARDFARAVLPGPMNAGFASSNRSKRSFGIDLKSPAATRIIHDLLRRADVVIENNATGVMDRLGLGYDTLKQINPRIILFSTQLLGSSGPWSRWIGYGPHNHAVSGLQYLWNYPEDAETPAGSTNTHPDHLVGRLGAMGVVAALIRRQRKGGGARIEVAQFEVLIQILGDLLIQESLSPGSVRPQGNSSERGSPWGVYPCSGEDEWCVINVRDDDDWAALVEALGRPAWAARREYDGVGGRREAGREIDEALAAWTRAHSPADVMALLQAHGVPAGAVQHPEQQVRDPHLAQRGFFQTLQQHGLGEVLLEGPVFRSRDMPGPRVESAPLLGEHTRDISRSVLGLSNPEIDRLVEEGVLEEAEQRADRN
jgi:crotonobetainyl-CoA:carnitine CoA-transferase CaiB-like acyl-CoA transferase